MYGITYPLAEETIRRTPLQDLVMVDEVIRDLYGRIEWIPSAQKIHRVLYKVGYYSIMDPAVTDAIHAVEERLAATQ